jgi:secondary thiamine-phosphate synthase enzyme
MSLLVEGGNGMESFEVRTSRRNEFVEITSQVRLAVGRSRLKRGMCVVYCPHTTAAITINENADPDVVHDMLAWLDKTIPKDQREFRHGEGNSDSHIKASLVGSSATVLVEGGDLVLGRWQGVYFCEFDGPRTRTVHVQVIGG